LIFPEFSKFSGGRQRTVAGRTGQFEDTNELGRVSAIHWRGDLGGGHLPSGSNHRRNVGF
jgi:hypothetical protein